MTMNVIWMGFGASLVAGLFTGVGAIGVFFIISFSLLGGFVCMMYLDATLG